jgi:hypothetical protein
MQSTNSHRPSLKPSSPYTSAFLAQAEIPHFIKLGNSIALVISALLGVKWGAQRAQSRAFSPQQCGGVIY